MEAKTVLIFARLTLALALVHSENEDGPLLVDLRARSQEMSYLPERQLLPADSKTPGTHQKPFHLAEVG